MRTCGRLGSTTLPLGSTVRGAREHSSGASPPSRSSTRCVPRHHQRLAVARAFATGVAAATRAHSATALRPSTLRCGHLLSEVAPPLSRHTAVLAAQRESSPTGNSLSRVLLRRGRANQRASSRDVFPSSRTRCRRRRSAGGTRDPRRVRLNAVRLRGRPRGRKVASILNPAGRCKTGADDGRRLTLHRRRRSTSRATCSGRLAGAKGRAPRSPAAQ